jgi:proteasome lid subunit RPN8/RPN11
MINPASFLLTPDVKRSIASHAKEDPNNEVCGVIADGKVIRCRNAIGSLSEAELGQIKARDNYSPDFILDAADWLKVQANNTEIQAVYHSHHLESHAEELSGADIQQSKLLKTPYIMYHTLYDSWDLYSPHFPHPYPLKLNRAANPKSIDFYLQRPWKYDRSDCYSLVWDYYRGVLGIDIGEVPRDKDPRRMITKDWDRYRQELPDRGFVHLRGAAILQDHDVVLMKVNSKHNPEHIGVIIDAQKSLMLHHPGDPKLSLREIYGGFWRDAAMGYGVYRHKSLV